MSVPSGDIWRVSRLTKLITPLRVSLKLRTRYKCGMSVGSISKSFFISSWCRSVRAGDLDSKSASPSTTGHGCRIFLAACLSRTDRDRKLARARSRRKLVGLGSDGFLSITLITRLKSSLTRLLRLEGSVLRSVQGRKCNLRPNSTSRGIRTASCSNRAVGTGHVGELDNCTNRSKSSAGTAVSHGCVVHSAIGIGFSSLSSSSSTVSWLTGRSGLRGSSHVCLHLTSFLCRKTLADLIHRINERLFPDMRSRQSDQQPGLDQPKHFVRCRDCNFCCNCVNRTEKYFQFGSAYEPSTYTWNSWWTHYYSNVTVGTNQINGC